MKYKAKHVLSEATIVAELYKQLTSLRFAIVLEYLLPSNSICKKRRKADIIVLNKTRTEIILIIEVKRDSFKKVFNTKDYSDQKQDLNAYGIPVWYCHTWDDIPKTIRVAYACLNK